MNQVNNQVSSVMAADVETLTIRSSLREASEVMKNKNLGALPVIDQDQVVGMITDRDIVIRGVAEGRNLDQTMATQAMTTDVVSCLENQTINEALELMRHKQVGRLVVLDQSHKLIGILSLGDVSRTLGQDRLAGLVLENVNFGFKGRYGRRATAILGITTGIAAILTGLSWVFSNRRSFERTIAKVTEEIKSKAAA